MNCSGSPKSSMPTVEELFGVTDSGEPKVRLQNTSGAPRQDIVLKTCYRNPPESIAVAHALGLGIYRAEGQVQDFDEPATWTDIGYELLEGELSAEIAGPLAPQSDLTCRIFREIAETGIYRANAGFQSEEEQVTWVAASIERDLRVDQLRLMTFSSCCQTHTELRKTLSCCRRLCSDMVFRLISLA